MKFSSSLFKKNKSVFFDGLLLFFLMTFFFMRWIFQERYMLFTSDVIQDFVMHHFVSFAFSQKEIPIWDPYFTWAIVGYLNSGIFYPLNIIMDLIQTLKLNNLNFGYLLMEGNAFFHYFLASFFMYLMCRNFSLSRLPSIIAGIVFAYSGYMVKEYVHLAYLQGAVWLPLVFMFFYKAVFEKKNYIILSAIFFAISLLAGQTQPGIYYLFALIMLVAYSIFYLYERDKILNLKPAILFIIFIFVSFGLFAIQFFPTNEYAKYTSRQEFTQEDVVAFSAKPLYAIVHPFIPTFWGSMSSKFWSGTDFNNMPLIAPAKTLWLDSLFEGLPNEMNFYVGLFPIFLLPFSFFSERKFIRNLFLIIFLFAFILMLSRSFAVIGQLFYDLVKGAARVPVRASFLWSFSLALLAALGIEVILEKGEKLKFVFQKIVKIYFLILGFLSLFVLPLLIFLMLVNAGSEKMVYFYFPFVDTFALFLIYFFIYSLLLCLLIRSQEKNLLLGLIVLIFLIDLFSYHAKNSYIIPSEGSPETLLRKKAEPEILYLKNDQDFFRVNGLGFGAYANNLFSLGYGAVGNAGFALRPVLELFRAIPDYGSPVYDLLNVKYFYTKDGKLNDFKSSVRSSSYLSGFNAYNAFDKIEDTEWVVDPVSLKEENQWIMVYFRQPEIVTRMEILGRGNDRDKEIKEFELSFSDRTSQKVNLPIKKSWKAISIKPVKTDWIKFNVTGFDLSFGKNEYFGLREINLINPEGKNIEVGSQKFQKITNNLYQNKKVFPRVFITSNHRSFENREEMFKAILNDATGEDMRRNVYLYEEPQKKYLSNSNPSGQKEAVIKEYKLKSVTVETNSDSNGFLVLADMWFPGWNAYLDGEKVHLYSAYQILRAIEIPKGRHTVVFQYEPFSFKLGAGITMVTIILLSLYFLFQKFSKKTFI